MATVIAPLFSFSASGKLAKTLVYFPYKSLKVVRSYVVPANPNTTGQQAQRSNFTDGVDEWHAAGYNAVDLTAWNVLAATLGGALSGFNAFMRWFINTEVAGFVWQRLAEIVISAVGVAGFTVTLSATSGGTAPVLHWGSSDTFMPNTITMSDLTGDSWDADLTGLASGVKYFFFIDRGNPNLSTNYGRTGIGAQMTA